MDSNVSSEVRGGEESRPTGWLDAPGSRPPRWPGWHQRSLKKLWGPGRPSRCSSGSRSIASSTCPSYPCCGRRQSLRKVLINFFFSVFPFFLSKFRILFCFSEKKDACCWMQHNKIDETDLKDFELSRLQRLEWKSKYFSCQNKLAFVSFLVESLKVKVGIDLAGDERELLAGARWARTTKLFHNFFITLLNLISLISFQLIKNIEFLIKIFDLTTKTIKV